MKRLQLMPIGNVDGELLQDLRSALAETLAIPCEILPEKFDPEFAYHGERQQYHSSEILRTMRSIPQDHSWRTLGVAAVDLYIPILTYVFGEAQIGGQCALLSTHRLRQEFYGLPADYKLLFHRTLKEAIHEIGHTLNPTHCDEYSCVMASSHAVEWIDLKDCTPCHKCRRTLIPSKPAVPIIY